MTLLRLCTLASIGLLALGACSRSTEVPRLMHAAAHQDSPDEFSIVPTGPLQAPPDFNSLPTPTPGGSNRVDPDARAAAVAALGGRVSAEQTSGIPAADAGLMAYVDRQGNDPNIRAITAAEDEDVRRNGRGRILERAFRTNLYRRAYEDQILDPQAELLRWRERGVRTPAAPPAPTR